LIYLIFPNKRFLKYMVVMFIATRKREVRVDHRKEKSD